MQKKFNVYIRKIVTTLNTKNEPISKGFGKVHLGEFRADTREDAIIKASQQSGYSLNSDFRAYEKVENIITERPIKHKPDISFFGF